MRLLLFLATLALASGCDFQPTLDIETPEHRPALALAGVLFADSTVSLRVTQSESPYAPRSTYRTEFKVLQTATVTMHRDGGPPEALFFERRPCNATVVTNPPPGYEERNECGAFASATPLRGGETVTVRAEAPGVAPVTATVTIPTRVAITATRERGAPRDGGDTDLITVRFRDAPGLGQRYSLDALIRRSGPTGRVCTGTPPVCETGRYTFVNQTSFSTRDPILVASLRGVPGNTNVVTFTDDLFDGQEHAFAIEALRYGESGNVGEQSHRVARVLSLSDPLYQAYQQSFYSFGDQNPFQEPSDLPSNVEGGYGLVGAAAVTEVDFGAP